MVSFVLVVHREQAYVAECAASVLDRGSGDVQLIAIDDASPDHGPAILDELAQRDPRVRVEHLNERVGLGAGRNLALELVEDDYVWFVNATDLLAPDAVPAVVERLREASPDVLLVHHSSSGALGPSRPGPHAEMLERLEELGPGALDERPAVADAAPRAFDKVLRTELLRELGARFGPAGHDELTVTWPALLAAERIAGLAEPGYVRREPPNAVRDRYVGGSPLDVFAQHDAVLEFVRAHGELPGARVALLEPALLRHQLALLRRVPDEQRREFFERMSERHRAQPR